LRFNLIDSNSLNYFFFRASLLKRMNFEIREYSSFFNYWWNFPCSTCKLKKTSIVLKSPTNINKKIEFAKLRLKYYCSIIAKNSNVHKFLNSYALKWYARHLKKIIYRAFKRFLFKISTIFILTKNGIKNKWWKLDKWKILDKQGSNIKGSNRTSWRAIFKT